MPAPLCGQSERGGSRGGSREGRNGRRAACQQLAALGALHGAGAAVCCDEQLQRRLQRRQAIWPHCSLMPLRSVIAFVAQTWLALPMA